MVRYWQAFRRGVRRGLGGPAARLDFSPEAQLARLAERMRPAVGSCPSCGAGDEAWCRAGCHLIDPMDHR